jgi:hypothetical protein
VGEHVDARTPARIEGSQRLPSSLFFVFQVDLNCVHLILGLTWLGTMHIRVNMGSCGGEQ